MHRTTSLLSISILAFSLGCQTSIKTAEIEEEVVQSPLTLGLNVEMSQESVLAGTLIPYSITVEDLDGNVIEDNLTVDITSDIESDLYWTATSIMPVKSGDHVFTVQVTYLPTEDDFVRDEDVDGIVLNKQFYITVDPLGVDIIDLQVDKGVAQAGENVPYRVIPKDRFDNPIVDATLESGIEFFADSPDLSIGSSQIYSTVADFYGLTATLGDLSDTEFLEVLPDDADNITLIVNNTDIEKYESTQCDVIVEDRFGNILDYDWTLWAEGDGLATTSYNIVTFLEEGTYYLYANTFKEDGTELIDSYGPILIDSSGPTLVINTPTRGDWTEATTSIVSGTAIEEHSALMDVQVDGVSTTVATDGSFSESMDLEEGLNIVETEAFDTDGNVSNDVRAVLSGQFELKDQPIEDAISIYVGSSGIDSLEDTVEGIVAGIDLNSLLPSNPVTSQGAAWCTAYVNVYNFSSGTVSLDIDPHSNGYIDVTMTVPSLSMNLDVPLSGGSWWQPCPDFNGDVSASSLTATLTLNPYVSNNQIYMNIVSSSSSLNGLNVSLNGWGSVLNFIVNFFEDDIADLLESEIESQLSTQVPGILESTLQSIALSTDFDLMGTTIYLDALPSSIFADNHGIGFGMETNVMADNWILSNTGLGSFAQGYGAPTFPSNSGYNVALSTDIINQLMYQVWGSGFISQEITLDDLNVDSEDLEILFPNSSDLRVTIEPLLPPTVLAENDVLEMQLGELYLSIHNGPYSAGDIRLEVYSHIFAPLTMGVNATSITATVGAPTTYFDVVYPLEGAQGTELLLEAIIPVLLPTFTDAISEIPLPSFSGVTLSGLTSTVDNGHLAVTGNVSF